MTFTFWKQLECFLLNKRLLEREGLLFVEGPFTCGCLSNTVSSLTLVVKIVMPRFRIIAVLFIFVLKSTLKICVTMWWDEQTGSSQQPVHIES